MKPFNPSPTLAAGHIEIARNEVELTARCALIVQEVVADLNHDNLVACFKLFARAFAELAGQPEKQAIIGENILNLFRAARPKWTEVWPELHEVRDECRTILPFLKAKGFFPR